MMALGRWLLDGDGDGPSYLETNDLVVL